MAEPSSGERRGHNSDPTEIEVLGYIRQMVEIEVSIEKAKGTVKERRGKLKTLRGKMEKAGIHLAGLDRARIDAARSGLEREAEEIARAKYLAYMKKPLGYQASMDLFVTEDDLRQADADGLQAGKAGDPHDKANSYTPGTEAYQRFKTAWLAGQGEKVVSEIKPTEPPKRRGRPPKAKANGEAPPMTEAEIAANMPGLQRVVDGELVTVEDTPLPLGGDA
jgi:hypothetical protein